MILPASAQSTETVRAMWKICFGDDDNYLDIYFGRVYSPDNTFIYYLNGEPVASLQMLQYTFTFGTTEIPVLYLAGLCTLPSARRQGIMAKLIERAINEAATRNVSLMFLVPVNEHLARYYQRFGFANAFVPDQPQPSLKAIIDNHPDNIAEAYIKFDEHYRTKEMTIQKSLNDFQTIIAEAALYNFPPKNSLPGMARIIDARKLLSLFAETYTGQSFTINLHDNLLPHNNGVIRIDAQNSKQSSSLSEISLTTQQLAPLLLGYQTGREEEPLRSLFAEKNPQIHFMLE